MCSESFIAFLLAVLTSSVNVGACLSIPPLLAGTAWSWLRSDGAASVVSNLRKYPLASPPFVFGQGAVFPCHPLRRTRGVLRHPMPRPRSACPSGLSSPPTSAGVTENKTGSRGYPREPDWLRSKAQACEFSVRAFSKGMAMSMRCDIIWPHRVLRPPVLPAPVVAATWGWLFQKFLCVAPS